MAPFITFFDPDAAAQVSQTAVLKLLCFRLRQKKCTPCCDRGCTEYTV